MEQSSGEIRREKDELCPAVIARESGRSSIPEAPEIKREAAAYWIARSSRAMTKAA
jgi:hypothetical protein